MRNRSESGWRSRWNKGVFPAHPGACSSGGHGAESDSGPHGFRGHGLRVGPVDGGAWACGLACPEGLIALPTSSGGVVVLLLGQSRAKAPLLPGTQTRWIRPGAFHPLVGLYGPPWPRRVGWSGRMGRQTGGFLAGVRHDLVPQAQTLECIRVKGRGSDDSRLNRSFSQPPEILRRPFAKRDLDKMSWLAPSSHKSRGEPLHPRAAATGGAPSSFRGRSAGRATGYRARRGKRLSEGGLREEAFTTSGDSEVRVLVRRPDLRSGNHEGESGCRRQRDGYYIRFLQQPVPGLGEVALKRGPPSEIRASGGIAGNPKRRGSCPRGTRSGCGWPTEPASIGNGGLPQAVALGAGGLSPPRFFAGASLPSWAGVLSPLRPGL